MILDLAFKITNQLNMKTFFKITVIIVSILIAIHYPLYKIAKGTQDKLRNAIKKNSIPDEKLFDFSRAYSLEQSNHTLLAKPWEIREAAWSQIYWDLFDIELDTDLQNESGKVKEYIFNTSAVYLMMQSNLPALAILYMIMFIFFVGYLGRGGSGESSGGGYSDSTSLMVAATFSSPDS